MWENVDWPITQMEWKLNEFIEFNESDKINGAWIGVPVC